MKEYRVKVCDGYVEHITPTSADAAYEGVWLWHHLTLALNYYGNGLSLERIVPTGPKTTEIRYTYLFRNAQDATEEERLQSQRAIDTSAEVCFTYMHFFLSFGIECSISIHLYTTYISYCDTSI